MKRSTYVGCTETGDLKLIVETRLTARRLQHLQDVDLPQAQRTRRSGTIHLLSKETKLQTKTRLSVVFIDVVLQNHPMQRAPSLAFTDLDTFLRLFLGPPARKQLAFVVKELKDGLEALDGVFRVFGLFVISLFLNDAEAVGIV